jgi:thioredoxin-like negative regulator of GroEL
MFKNALPMYMLLLIVLACAAIFMTSSEGFESSPKTLLNDIEGKKVVALFYTDSCGYCKQMKPEWDKASEKASGRMVAVNCSDSGNEDVQALLKNTETSSFPRMVLMDDGNIVSDYEGPRTEEDILQFVHSNVA